MSTYISLEFLGLISLKTSLLHHKNDRIFTDQQEYNVLLLKTLSIKAADAISHLSSNSSIFNKEKHYEPRKKYLSVTFLSILTTEPHIYIIGKVYYRPLPDRRRHSL